MKRSSCVVRMAWGGRHVEAAAEADSCGVEAVRVTVNTCGLWGSEGDRGDGGVREIEAMKAGGRWRREVLSLREMQGRRWKHEGDGGVRDV
ncbi:hypothetical protein SO802_033380 [Lithocarpus litseifolius]|uniref:Uncharacterized protein n=1 Tax=Lithocarpus litseifolius TaxID=425828 RepID=A0AAW2BCW0_9ROSI